MHSRAPRRPPNPAVYFPLHLATARLLEVLLRDIAVLRHEGVALVAEEEQVQMMTHMFRALRIRDPDRQHRGGAGEPGLTRIPDPGLGRR